MGRLKSPEGTAPGREIPLIGVADVSLRGLGSPEEGEQKTFWSPSCGEQRSAGLCDSVHGARLPTQKGDGRGILNQTGGGFSKGVATLRNPSITAMQSEDSFLLSSP